MGETKYVWRFPELAKTTDIVAAAESIWERPSFTVHVNPAKTEFVFTLPFSLIDKLKASNPDVYTTLAHGTSGAELFSDAMQQAYSQLRLGKKKGAKSVAQSFDTLLYKTFKEALAVLGGKTADLFSVDHSEWVKAQRESLRKAEKKERRRRSSKFKANAEPQMVSKQMAFASRYSKLLKEVQTAHRFLLGRL